MPLGKELGEELSHSDLGADSIIFPKAGPFSVSAQYWMSVTSTFIFGFPERISAAGS